MTAAPLENPSSDLRPETEIVRAEPLPNPAIELRQGELTAFGTTVWSQAAHYLAAHSNGAVTEQMLQDTLRANPYAAE